MGRMNVLISGGGIAGNAAAFWLSKLGHNVTVVERFPTLRASGLQIDLRGHGIEVMRRMGLEEEFRSKLAPEQGLRMVDHSGRQRAYFGMNKSGKGLQAFTTEFEIMRGDLCRLLYDATKDRAKYVFGTSIESFEETDNVVKVRFADGKVDRFNLLVGADGQWSRTRRMMLGPNAADPFQPLKDYYVGYFTVPQPIQEGEEYISTAYLAARKRGIMTRRHSPHEFQVYMSCQDDSGNLENSRRGGIKEQKMAMTEIFQGAKWRTEEFLRYLKDADDFYCERLGLVQLDSWSQGRVVMLGDAAYCPSPSTGMGTTSAIVGAYVLAGEISRCCGHFNRDSGARDGDGVVMALKAYEEKFQPFMKQVQHGLAEGSRFRMPSSEMSVSMVNFLMGLASRLRVNVFGDWFLRENVKGWDLPEYQEMNIKRCVRLRGSSWLDEGNCRNTKLFTQG